LNRHISHIITTGVLLILLTLPVAAHAKGVVLNFSDVDISTMVKFISDLTGKNFVMDDRVKGKISVFSPAKLSTDEAFNVFTSVLELKGFTIVQAGRVYKIVPIAAAKQQGMRILGTQERGPVNEAYVARVIPLDSISSQEAVTFLQPIVSKDGYISAFGPTNMLLMVDSYLNIEKVLGILQLIDTKKHRAEGELLFLKNASAENAANVAREWLGSKEKAQQRTPGQSISAGGGGIIIPDTRLNALIVFGSDKEKEDVKKLIALIDVVPPTSSSKVNVYYLEYADATDMAKVLDGVIKGYVALPSAPGAPPQQTPFEGGKITINPDKATNSLVIMASTTDYQNLLQVIQKLDKRRRQVFVEATIAEVSLTKLKELGIQWSFFGGVSNGTIAGAGFYDTFNSLSSFTQLLGSLVTAGLVSKEAQLGSSANFAAILKLLDSTGTVNVLSTPNILTSDNKEAEIFVGENIPLIGQTNLSSTGLSQQSITRQDTGIILRITPQISEGDYVKLDIYQEISAVKPISDPKASDITTTKRSAKTAIVVKNAETVVIGGLISERVTEQISKVPLLGDIPLIGWAFKSKSTQREKTNLLIILQPHIIKSVEDLADVSAKQSARFDEKSGQSKLESPEEETKKPQ